MTSAFLRFIFILLCFVSVAYAQKNAPPRAGTIAYVRGGTEVRLINADGTNDHRLWTHPTRPRNSALMASRGDRMGRSS